MKNHVPVFLRRLSLLAMCVAITAHSAPVPASNSTSARTVAADIRRDKGPLDRMFDFCVGAGRANEGLRADWQQQLERVHRECGFRYIRMHGLLCDDMGVYKEDGKGNPVYNWQYIDKLYDFLLGIGMKPFVELGFMPSALASGKRTIFWWHGNVTQPKDPKKWADLIRALVAHWTERYGEGEVRTWYFEVWNEPNLSQFFAGSQADYFRLYAETARAIKSVSPEYRVGGPATAGNAWIPEMIAFCSRNRVPIDFISTHDYAVTQGFLDVNGNAGTMMDPSPDAIYRNIRKSRAQIAASAMPNLELHYTEWSTSYTPFDPVHDSYVSAAFILDKVRNSAGYAQSMSYWVFTDIFEEAGPRMRPFHGGFGLLNLEGIPKPSYFAYHFLNRLGGHEVPCSDPASYVCRDDRGGVQALFWDFTLAHPHPPVNNQVYYVRDLPAAPGPRVELRLSGLPAGLYELEISQAGYRVNDPYDDYRDLGLPSQLTRPQVAFLKSRNPGTPETERLIEVGEDGMFSREFPMRTNDVFFVQLRPVAGIGRKR